MISFTVFQRHFEPAMDDAPARPVSAPRLRAAVPCGPANTVAD